MDKRPPSSSSVLGLINAERNINCLFTSCSQNGTDMVMLLQNVEIVVRHPKRISFFFSALQAPFCMVVIFWVTFLPPWVSFYRESFSNHEGAEAKTSLLTRLRFILRREYSDSRSNLKCRWPHLSSEREKEICSVVFTPSIKRSLREIHVVVVQWQQRNVQGKLLSCWSYQLLFDVLVPVAVVVVKAP